MASFLPHLILLLLLMASTSADVFLSIDCGESKSYTDESKINWVGDDAYTKRGESRVVQNTSSVARPLTTLRVFTSRKKNCYPISVPGGGKILLRTSFYYGNYDGKSSPPTFDLDVDGESWVSVETTMGDVVSYEGIYTTNGNGTSVCVAQTQAGNLPFISTIEVKSLKSTMYPNLDSNRILLLSDRVAFGASDFISYPDDPFDRIWVPLGSSSDGLTVLRSNTTSPEINVPDLPPAIIFQSAVVPSTPSGSISLSTSLPNDTVDVFVNLYFAEISQLGSTEQRTFEVYKNGVLISEPLSPPNQSVLEFYIHNETGSADTQFVLQATPDSTLPPIISAMEVFMVSDVRSATDGDDVDALAILQRKFAVLSDWNGDPCLPESYNWEWVGCSSDANPRITALYLNGLGLSGDLPDFSALDALETIDLHNNSLSGNVPEFLGKLPNLTQLNLADNGFTGSIPSSLSQNNKIKLDFSGNPLCKSGQPCQTSGSSPPAARSKSSASGKKESNNLGLILGLVMPFAFSSFVGLGVVY